MALICLAPTCTMELFCYSASERWWGGTVDILPYSLLIGNSLYKPDRHDHKPELVLDGGPNYYYYYYATTCVCQNASRMTSDALHPHEKLYKNGKRFLCAYLTLNFFSIIPSFLNFEIGVFFNAPLD